MDNNITRALEIGVAFMIFVVGLGTFFVISSGMTRYQREANQHEAYSESYASSGDVVLSEPISDSALYYILKNRGQQRMYLDGVMVEHVESFEQAFELKEILALDGYSDYSEMCVVNDRGDVVEVHYIGVP